MRDSVSCRICENVYESETLMYAHYIENSCFLGYEFQKARQLGKFGGKLTKFEDIGVDLNKVI